MYRLTSVERDIGMMVGVHKIRHGHGSNGRLMWPVSSSHSHSSLGLNLGFLSQVVYFGFPLLLGRGGMVFVSRSHLIHVDQKVEGIPDLEYTLRIEYLPVEQTHQEGGGVDVVLVGIDVYGNYDST